MSKTVIWFIPAICVMLGILLLSTAVAVPIKINGVSFQDKLYHAFAYFVLVFSFLFGFKKSRLLNRRLILQVVIGAMTYGTMLELIQYVFFDLRAFEWFDMLANIVGSLIGLLVFNAFKGVI
jgi:VanZ family protein